MLKRHYLGFEIVKEYYEFAKKRLYEIEDNNNSLIKWIENDKITKISGKNG